MKREMHLYETHLPVKDTEVSSRFYVDVVGLEYAHRDLTRDVIFLWIGSNKRSMLGLWGPTTSWGAQPRACHFAIGLSRSDLLAAGPRLSMLGVVTRNFSGKITTEPSVIGWMPSAQLYFSDPDGHTVEYITLLHETPESSFVGSLSAWKARRKLVQPR
jgi:lactoylglutathione lyase